MASISFELTVYLEIWIGLISQNTIVSKDYRHINMAAEKIPGWIDALELNVNTRIDSVESQIISLMNETKTEI